MSANRTRCTRAMGIALALGCLGNAGTADGYSFRDPRYRAVGPADAPRWLAGPEGITFRLLENDNDDGITFSDGRAWQDTVRSALSRWNGVSTAAIRLRLDERPVAADWGVDDDGLNTIGVSSFPPLVSRPTALVTNSATIRGGFILGCDIELNRAALLAAETSTRRLEANLLHQIGHCLGLGHTEPFPDSRFSLPEYDPDERPGFPASPDPVMSRGDTDARLTDDDRTALSLLYPAPGFHSTHGAVRGELQNTYGTPAAHAFVQTVRVADGEARPGPGAFADSDGRFLVEGLAPGPVLLVIHPIVDPWSYIFRSASQAVADQWRFAEVHAGEVTESVGPRLRVQSRR